MTPDDWIAAAFRALLAGGPAAVKVEAIARDLKATKGSFYWHFADLAALKAAMLATWRTRGVGDVVAAAEARAATPVSRLMVIAELAAVPPPPEFGGASVEPAMRDWGRSDVGVAATVAAIDTARREVLTGLFAAAGLAPEEAGLRARIAYAAYVGLAHLGGPEGLDPGGLDATMAFLTRDLG